MTINSPVYASREDVKRAADFKETARSNDRVDRALESASRSVEGLTHRTFYPETATRYFDWPDRNRSMSWRLWLHADELVSATTVTAGGTTISASDFFLEPANSGPPYNRVEIDLESNAAFASDQTHQRAIEIAGVWGHDNETAQVATLAEALDSSETGVDVDDSSGIGVGSLLLVGSERMLVTDVANLDTGQNTGAGLTSQANDVTVTVTTGSDYHVGEVITVDSESMLIVGITGNDLTVKRAWDGSVLAAHSSGADIYAPRTLTVQRGALGSTAASASLSDPVSVQLYPGPVRDLTIAEALSQLHQESAGYARVVGTGDNVMESAGRGLRILRDDVFRKYGRKLRMRAV
ncbi:MAG: hypothetical protein ACRD0W_22375 [Acidimicrobiales bacterium]